MKYLPFGKTGVSVSELGFGAIPVIRLTFDEAERVLRTAFDRGITLFDTANLYHDSEEKIGRALSPVRDKIFLATKSMKRDGKSVAEHIDLSLKRLKTDYVDLFQFHQVAQEKDREVIYAPGGAMEAALAAQRAGKVRFIGVSSHSIPMAMKLIRTGDFVSIQFPFNFIETEAADALHSLARELGVAILAMKPFAGGAITDAALAFKYLRSHADLFPIPGYDSAESVEQVVSFYDAPNNASGKDFEEMARIKSELGGEFCRRCEYCQPCPFGVAITGGMIYPLLASRMSPKVASGFAAANLDTVPNCTECGVCVTRCPYTLPIPAMLKKHYELYLEHRNSKE